MASKYIAIISIVLLLTACNSDLPQHELHRTGDTNIKCLQGVVYYWRIYGMAPAFKQDGSLFTCPIEKENND